MKMVTYVEPWFVNGWAACKDDTGIDWLVLVLSFDEYTKPHIELVMATARTSDTKALIFMETVVIVRG